MSARSRVIAPVSNWAWQQDAECKNEPLELFFGKAGENRPERELRERQAAAVCARCPVRAACLDYAVSKPEKYGTWGGLSEDQRVAERRRRMRRANAA